jgi:hypothetical protein
LDIHFTVGTSSERAAPLAEQNAAARHHVLRSLHEEHRVFNYIKLVFYILHIALFKNVLTLI